MRNLNIWFINNYSKKCWVVSSQIWVKYGQTQMVKNVIKKKIVESES